MPAAPIPSNESERLAALRSCEILDSPPETGFDDLTVLASRLADAPIALVSLVDGTRQWFKSSVGCDLRSTPREQAVCGYAILEPGALVIPDLAADPRTADNPLVTGEPRLRAYTGIPLRLNDGLVVGTLCAIDLRARGFSDAQIDDLMSLARQATAQLELRRALHGCRVASEAAEEAGRARSAFLANMSHEIRTPMTAILGFAEMLGNESSVQGSRDASESVRAIRRNAEHLLHLMNDVLDMSKLGEGKLLIRETSADIAELLDDVRLFAESRARAAGLGFRIELTTQTPGAIRTDPGRLRQVLFNLLGNALKFTHEGSITLRCWFDSMTEQIVFEIEDTGIGMDVPTLQRVRAFEAFTQGDGSSARRHGGTGLGLHISHSLAQLLGGSIEIESAPGRGSTFFVSVATGEIEGGAMLLDGRFAGRSKPEGAAPPDPTDSSPLRGRRILVADDNPDNRRLLTHHLGRAGAETEVAGNGREAVERVRADDYGFDLVLTDLQMPELDGYGAARALRSLGFAGPIIAVTANDLGSDRRASLEAGCDSYLTKPIDARQLVQTCLESLRNSRTAGADAA